MGRRARHLAAGLFVILVLTAALWGIVKSSGDVPESRVSKALDEHSAAAVAVEVPATEHGRETRRADTVAVDGADSTTPPIIVRGQIVDPEGSPIPEAPVRAEMDEDNVASSTTGADGCFELTLPWGLTSDFRIRAGGGGYARESWYFDFTAKPAGLDFEHPVDLGTFELTRAGVIVGRIVSRSRTPVQRPYRVLATSNGDFQNDMTPFDQRGYEVIKTRVNPASGEFRLEDVAEGVQRILVEATPDEKDVAETCVVVIAGETHDMTIEVPGSAQCDTIFVDFRCESLLIYAIDTGSVSLVGEDGVVHAPSMESGSSARDYAFSGLVDGVYTLRVQDPHFLPVTLEGLRPSDNYVDVKLVGTSAIELEVLDTATQMAVPCRVRVRSLGHGQAFVSQAEVESRPTRIVIRSLPSTEVELVSCCDCHREKIVTVPDLAPGETRHVKIELDDAAPSATVTCHVTTLGGAIPSNVSDLTAQLYFMELVESRDGSGHTDSRWTHMRQAGVDNGRAVFYRVVPGRHVIAVVGSGTMTAKSEEFDVPEDASDVRTAVAVSSTVTIRGKLTVPDELPDSGHLLSFVADLPTHLEPLREQLGQQRTAIAITRVAGSFEVRGLAPGFHRIFVNPALTRRLDGPVSVVEFEIGAVHVGLDPQNPLTLDLPRSALASLEVEVLVNRKPAGHVMLRLQDDDGGNTDDRMTNVHGVYRFPIVSGKSKDLYVWPVGSWWALRVQEALEVKGAATKHRVDIAVGRRRFRVLTPEGLPVARREVEIAGAFGKDAYFGKSRRFETDDSGFVTLEVPSVPGMVSVCFHEMRASVEIDRPSSKDLDVKLTN